MVDSKVITTCVDSTQGKQTAFEWVYSLIRFHRQFYDVPALKPYKWYWRVEPDVEFSCAIP